jgi:cellulose synthase/poly-beta-1,6-N-acetylglucosamine synthase-like glycosyltransferase
LARSHRQIRHITDPGKGKPTALNTAFRHAKGEILILSDGDVYVGRDSVKHLLAPFKNQEVGAVSARPMSINPKTTMLGYWSHLLTDAGAHLARTEDTFIICTGYLFAMRKLIDTIPHNALADDAVMSYMIWQKGYRIMYAPSARVYVKYPTTFNDWILQKKRSAGGYHQIPSFFGNVPVMRGFRRELLLGWYKALRYPRGCKEFTWTIALFLARLYLWIRIFIDIKVRKESFAAVWKRVETTK